MAASPRPRFISNISRRLQVVLGTAALLLAVATPVIAARVVTDPEPDKPCPAAYGGGAVTWYATTVDTPASGPWQVEVEFTLEGGTCQLTLASYELPGPTFTLPQQLWDSATGTFGPGTHVLTVDLPKEADLAGCFSQYDFVFGPALETLTGTDKYGDRQIRARIAGSDTCAEGNVQPSTSATTSPTQDIQGGTGTPAPEIPDTAMPRPADSQSAIPLAIASLLFVLSLGGVAALSVVRTRRR